MEARGIIGTALAALAVAFTAYLSAVMLRRIGKVVLKDAYRRVFLWELLACAAFLLLALDVRFGFLTGLLPRSLKIAGWALRCAAI